MITKSNENEFLEEVRSYLEEEELEKILKRSIKEAITHISSENYCKRLSTSNDTTYQKPNFKDYLFYDKSAIAIKKRVIRLQVRDRLTGQVNHTYRIYTPMPDIALAPFNLKEETARYMCNICEYLEKKKFITRWIEELKLYYEENIKRYPEYEDTLIQVIPLRKNPRCFIAVEVCFTGSKKHTLGSMVNASLLGYYSILVTREDESEKGVKLKDALKLKQYLLKVQELKAPGRIATNTIIVTDRQFIESIRKLSC